MAIRADENSEFDVNHNPEFNVSGAHRYFSADCFNRAWRLIDKSNRSQDEDEQMRLLTLASLWHWTQREDCSSRNLSIGYWQASRIHSILGRADEARRYGALCLHHSRQELPFFSPMRTRHSREPKRWRATAREWKNVMRGPCDWQRPSLISRIERCS
jgi:hypothetical protein